MEGIKRILLVEDESLIALACSYSIESWGYRVETVATGEEAVLRATGVSPPDLILMDIDLGAGMNGSDAASAILNSVSVPIVFLTSHAEREMVERVKGITRYGYVIKNSGDFVLRSSIEMALELFQSHRDIEDQMLALRESETLYRMLLENSIDAIYLMDYEGKVLNVNRVACTSLGYTHDELLRLGIGDIDANFTKDKFKDFWNLKPKGSTLVFETRHRHKDGHVIDVEVNGIFFELSGRKYLYGVARDITARKHTQQLLEAEQQKMLNVFRAVNAGTWEWNIQSGEAVVDEGSAALLGYTLEELNPVNMRTWMGMKHPDDMQEATRCLERHVNGETEYYEFESRMKHKDGHWVWIQGRGKVSTWTVDGKPLMMFGTHADISRRKLAEEELRAKNAELSLTLKEVHHRIKNNMNSMQSLLSIKEDSISDPVAIAALEDSRSRLRSLMVMYDKLYRSSDVNKISAREYLSTLVDEIIANYPSGNVFNVNKDIDDFELGTKHSQALGIIINELLTNIMKYAFADSEGAIIHVSVKHQDLRVKVVVADNGCGLPDSLDFTRSTGFGLQLIAGLVAQIGGTARIERGEGTKVIIEFSL
jgi:PAS domain S-box-containing protein